MTYQQASARVLDRIRLNNRRRNHLVANPDDAEFERSDDAAALQLPFFLLIL